MNRHELPRWLVSSGLMVLSCVIPENSSEIGLKDFSLWEISAHLLRLQRYRLGVVDKAPWSGLNFLGGWYFGEGGVPLDARKEVNQSYLFVRNFRTCFWKLGPLLPLRLTCFSSMGCQGHHVYDAWDVRGAQKGWIFRNAADFRTANHQPTKNTNCKNGASDIRCACWMVPKMIQKYSPRIFFVSEWRWIPWCKMKHEP